MKIKSILTAVIILAVFAAGPARAAWPEKPIRLICWSSAGSSHDLMARMVAKLAEQYLGQTIVVENREGGGGKVAMSYVLNLKPDGYTIMSNTRSMTELFPDPAGKMSIDEFRYVSRMVRDPFVIAVRADSPLKTIDDLIAKAKANPGKVTMGGFSVKSVDESLVIDFEKSAGIDLNYIPYKGGSEPVVAVLGGHIESVVSNPGEVNSHFQAGKLRVLALATEERFAPFDDVPTLKEKGYPIVTEHWRGIMVDKDVPEEVVVKLNEALTKVVEHPEFAQFLKNTNMYPGYMPEPEFTALVKEQTNK